MRHALAAFAVCLLSCASTTSAAPEDPSLSVHATAEQRAAARQKFSRALDRAAELAFAHRRAEYEATTTPEQIADYQQRRREFFLRQLGGWPDRTPLNARIVDTLVRDGYRIEKLIFESRPRHYVTALFYLPASPPRWPGVIVPCGHVETGKAGYQEICILLARHGIAALCYDPIGQGERFQILDDAGKPQFRMTDEHTLVGVGSILVGRNTASYRVWDGVRALDYLASRPEIDPERLGCTGSSGGGTLTEYLMAIDPRIVCAVPSCCVSTFERRVLKHGVGDAEQNIFGQIAFGLDHADYALMRAPRPTLFCTATHDFVDIAGSWDIFREAKRFYARFGRSEQVDLIEVDGKHGYTQPKREAAVRWMCRWLLNRDELVVESAPPVLPAASLLCTDTGQVQRLAGAVSVTDLNVARMNELAPRREALWQPGRRVAALGSVRRVAGIRPLAELPLPEVVDLGSVERSGYRVEKRILRLADGVDLPALYFKPAKQTAARVLYVHSRGAQAAAAPDGPIETLVRDGHAVLALDVRGTGETGAANDGGLWGGDWYDIFLAYLLGRSVLGMRAEDMLVAARYLAADGADQSPTPVKLVAQGRLTPAAIHAAVLEPQLFASVSLVEPAVSWQDVVRDPAPRGHLVNVVHGALEHYDLTDLLAVLREAGKLTTIVK